MTSDDDAKTVYIGAELSDINAKQSCIDAKPPDGAADLFVDTAKQFDSDAE